MLPNIRPPTIVIVDDNEAVLGTARTTLEGAGFRVLCHSRASGCVALILREKPDLVLIDVNMPLIASDTIVKLFGKAQPNSETLVLLHSALSVSALDAKARSCGAHGFIQKSDDPYQLVRQVNSWLKRSGNLSSGKMPAASRFDWSDEEGAVSRRSGTRPIATRFTISESSLAAINPEPSLVSGAPPALPCVLFVDDDMAALSGIRREVQREPYVVEFALSGNHALRKILSESPPDLVVSDLLMPSPDGIDVYRRAVAADRRWEKRFLFLTGAGIAPEVAAFTQEYRGLVLDKPVLGDRLRAAIREGLSALAPAASAANAR